MNGWKTIAVNAVGLLASVLMVIGIPLSPEDQATLASALAILLSIGNIVLRHFTNGPVGYLKTNEVSHEATVITPTIPAPSVRPSDGQQPTGDGQHS